METADTTLSIDTTDYFVLDDELIVFSATKQEYFGIHGAARLVFDTLAEINGSATAKEVEQLIRNSREIMPTDSALIHEAVKALLELGVLREL
ncbi:hypothetical protein C9I57_10245 [Trinickia symbiotica]|uniref:PqqD family protein n=1 Tax=Trinickia symbiotica TaxID=863227 RepID=A0A2T3XX45_9BURK|nr:hypothetical protein [Trinickia symbiotica]PTB21083.1 hypothetical protein C9I57_10245 [Trinickia symbiotica]